MVQAGTLTGTYQTVPQFSQVNLSQTGALDWIHWGTYTEYAFDRKAGVVPLISNYTLLGNPFADYGPFQFGDNYNGYTWNDGTPDASVTNTTTGVYLLGKNDGYQFTVPADTTTRVLKVYVGAYGAAGTFTASLSDGGSYSSSAVNYAGNGPAGLYTLTYAAASSNRTLTVKFILSTLRDRNYGNVTLQAAALSYAVSNNPPTVALLSPEPNATYLATATIGLAASAFDKDGTITNVQFFAGTNLLGESGSSLFGMNWSNAPTGKHFLTARAFDNNGATWTSRPVTVFVTGTNGFLLGTVAQTSSNIVLSVEGTRDWTHWGLVNASSLDRKVVFAPMLPNFQAVGTNSAQQLTDDLTAWSWAGGTPHATATNSKSGVYIRGYTNGFELQLPAGTNLQTVKIDIGVYAARGEMQAFLSDFSAPAVADTSRQNLYGRASGVCSFRYASASANQKLIVRYTADSLYDSSFGSVALLSSVAIAGPPSVTLFTPTNGTVVGASSAILIQAEAMNPDGPINAVTFYHDGVILGTKTNAPFRVFWTNAVPGSANIYAIAIDAFGGAATSAPVALTIVSNLPSPVHLISPRNTETFVAGTNITLEVILDPPFSAQSVEFFAGDTALGQVSAPPFSLVWSNVAAGLYSLTASATDLSGLITTSLPVSIAVDPNKPPSVMISTPANGSVFHWSAPVTVTALASDTDGFISLVEIFDGGTKLAEAAGSACTVVLSNASSRVYSLTARATDNWLAGNTSAPVIVTITNLPPIVTITNPIEGAVAWAGSLIRFGAEAVDPDGLIQRVRFYERTNLVGESTAPPFTMTWSNAVSGSFTFMAVVDDNDGATASSLPVSITLRNPAPIVSITNPIADTVFSKFTNVTIEASAGDTNGVVTNVAFFVGTNLLANASSPPFVVVWTNVPPGHYSLTAAATDNEGAVTVSPPVDITVLHSSITGDISGTFQVLPEAAEINLSQEGPLDWIHWGTHTQFASDRKAGISPIISDYSLLGDPNVAEGPFPFIDNLNGYSWWDGTPDAAVVNTTTGVYLSGINHGFQITVPSDTTNRILKVYVGAYAGEGTLTAFLSDGSGYSSTDLNYITNGPAGVYTINYLSASSNQMLTVRYVLTSASDPNVANCTLQAAALSYATDNNPPSVAITGPSEGVTVTNGVIPITAISSDSDGTITNIEFYAGTNRLGQSVESPYTFQWTNAALGRHIIFAKATDNKGARSTSLPVTVFVTGTTGSLIGNVAPIPSTVVLSQDGTRDWIHWGGHGAMSADRKTGVPSFFSDLQTIGTNTIQVLNDVTEWSWVDGIPTSVASNSTTGVCINGYTNGFELQLPANALIRTARVYVGVSGARGRMQAFLSDYSAPAFTDTSLQSVSGNESGVFTFHYAAASTNQKLIVRYTADSIFDWTLGSVNLFSATAVAAQSFVNIVAPANGASLDCSHPPQIQIEATNADGIINGISFYGNDVFIVRGTNSPLTFTWSNAVPGSYVLTAIATDMFGGTATSAPVAVTLVSNTLPLVSFTTPTEGGVFIEHTNLVLRVEASDVDGSVASVVFFGGTNSLGTVTNAPFSMIWSNVPLGSFALTARAVDNEGASAISTPVNVLVVTNVWPSVQIISPTNGTLFSSSDMAITVTASDSDGFVTLLELFDGPTKLAESTGTNLTFTWINPPTGTHVLTARAVDNWFGPNTSASVQVVVTNPLPIVEIATPVDGAVFIESSNIVIEALASDANGSIAKVEFFAGVTRLGDATFSPYLFTWTNVAAGNYAITAWATDNSGASNVSVAVNIAVTNPPPLVAITNPVDGSLFLPDSDITIQVAAHDSNGSIARIEFFAGTNRVGEVTNSPYMWTWTNVPIGLYALTATATDNNGASSTSAVVNAIVSSNSLPSAEVLAPTNGSLFVAPTNITITASGSDEDGIITLLELFDGTNRLAQSTNSLFTLVWTNAAVGWHALTARATDNRNGSAISSAIDIVVSNPPPFVAITNPMNNAAFLEKNKILIQAQADDANGSVSEVQFYVGNQLLGSAGSPFQYTWTNTQIGSYILTAVATDNEGATNRSARIFITIVKNSAAIRSTPDGEPSYFDFPLSTQTDLLYTVESASSVDATDWQTVTNLLGTGEDILVSDLVSTNGYRFYRVKVRSQ